MSDGDVMYALVGLFRRYLCKETCIEMKHEYRGNIRGFLDEAFDLIVFNRTGKKVGSSYLMNDGSKIETDDESVRVYRNDRLVRAITL